MRDTHTDALPNHHAICWIQPGLWFCELHSNFKQLQSVRYIREGSQYLGEIQEPVQLVGNLSPKLAL